MFSSQKISRDPWPYVWAGHSERDQMRADTHMFRKGAPSYHPTMPYQYRPRPEFDNNPNPVLELFREGRSGGPLHEDARDYLRAMSEDQWAYASDQANVEVNTMAVERGATDAHYAHARKVLQRLVNMSR